MKREPLHLPKQYGIVTDSAHLSLADTRNEAAKIRALRRSGIDIQVQAEEVRIADSKRDDADSNSELRRSFNDDVLPKLGGCRISDLTEHELLALLRAVVSRGANRTAVRRCCACFLRTPYLFSPPIPADVLAAMVPHS